MLLVHESGIVLDSSPSRLDLDAIERWLAAESYWALGRPRSAIENSIANSLVYGLYLPAPADSYLSASPGGGRPVPAGDSGELSASAGDSGGYLSAFPGGDDRTASAGDSRVLSASARADRLDRGQIGFFRVVTDKTTFAWLCDVFVDAAYRGRGLAQWALAHIRDEILAMGVHRILLATADAHAVYEKLGFKPHAEPGRWMELTTRRIGES